ncbi:right-handed parallel beta-helix repeat-containing protein [Auraticoccus monumenti]|uniref:right-handed parallel beta-helix repeat-containing protein n=1 Tax=Auraticoccus monumenti TaxID=675864 RepID=UPI000B89F5E5|nr:right-handed parallel beta-helix repeat-containing protein [Auraticoccus monumenti]
MSNKTASVGNVQPGRSFSARLATTSVEDGLVRAELTLPSVPGFYYAVEARVDGDGSRYRGRLRVDSAYRLHSELMRVGPGGREKILATKALDVVEPGQRLRVELSVSGSTSVSLASRVHPVGSSSTSWHTRFDDRSSERLTRSGPVGLWGYVSGSHKKAATITTHAFSVGGPAVASPPPTATPSPKPGAPTTGAGASIGSLPVGKATYRAPADALYVAPSGKDSARGTKSEPLRTVTQAIHRARDGQTVVLRAGRYHESILVPPQRVLTIQAYPGEAVWFDGAESVKGFARDGAAWVKRGWDTDFDTSPTYGKGLADSTQPGWQWINPDYPLAAHPDQLWIDGKEQRQVRRVQDVKAGTFYVDNRADRLWIGSDPAGRLVEASTLATAISLRAPGSTIRGFGVKRYANSVPSQGVITTYYPSMRLENIVVEDSATAGIGVYGANCVLEGVTIRGSGQMGLQGNKADNLRVNDLRLEDNNDQRFNPTPAAGGFKITTSRGVSLTNSHLSGTWGSAFWTDHSVHDITVVGNTITGNHRYGVVLELSSTAVVADNVITGNAFDGILVANSDNVAIWNNSIAGNRNAVAVTLDKRRNDGKAMGADPRRPRPDTAMPWISRNITLGNNVLHAGGKASATVSTNSYERVMNGNDMITSSEGNVFASTDASPGVVTAWARKNDKPSVHSSLSAHQRVTGRDQDSEELDGTTGLTKAGVARSATQALAGSVAQRLPARVAEESGLPRDIRWLGATHTVDGQKVR